MARGGRNGRAAWFFFGNALSPAAAILLGPLILGKVGLELYAVLGLASYFSNMLVSYADFSTSTYLLAAFSKKSPSRFTDLGSAVILRLLLWFGFLVVLIGFLLAAPRDDALYALIAISLPGALLPTACFEWYLIANQRYASLFFTRVTFVLVQVALTIAWFFSPVKSEIFVPVIILISGTAASCLLLALIGAPTILRAIPIVRGSSLRDVGFLVWKIAPMTAVLLLGPYFVAYALPWFSMVSDNPTAEGAFSVSYRLIIGLHALAVPLVLYLLSRAGESIPRVTLTVTAGYSIVLAGVFWLAGTIVIRYYYATSNVDSAYLAYSLKVFSVLMISVFFVVLRSPYVAGCLHAGAFRRYFLIHAVSSLPFLALSWLGRDWISSEAVPWLACLPDASASVLFMLSERRNSAGTGPRAMAAGRE